MHLVFGEPGFIRSLELLLAEEILRENPKITADVDALFDLPMDSETVLHSVLKEYTKRCELVIRTGEVSPDTNVTLQSAGIFRRKTRILPVKKSLFAHFSAG